MQRGRSRLTSYCSSPSRQDYTTASPENIATRARDFRGPTTTAPGREPAGAIFRRRAAISRPRGLPVQVFWVGNQYHNASKRHSETIREAFSQLLPSPWRPRTRSMAGDASSGITPVMKWNFERSWWVPLVRLKQEQRPGRSACDHCEVPGGFTSASYIIVIECITSLPHRLVEARH